MASILLVDDEPNIRFFYSDVLTERGHRVYEAASGDEAMHVIAEKSPDLVVLDIKLASENGLHLLQHIVRDYPDVPVILLTAYISFQDDYTSWLAHQYILKSNDPSEFLQAVDEVLRTSQWQASAGA